MLKRSSRILRSSSSHNNSIGERREIEQAISLLLKIFDVICKKALMRPEVYFGCYHVKIPLQLNENQMIIHDFQKCLQT